MDVLSSKTYLEIAKNFVDVPDVRDRYILMALKIGKRASNPYSSEASILLKYIFRQNPTYKTENKRTDYDKEGYKEEMDKPISDYDQADCYTLFSPQSLAKINRRRMTSSG